MSTTTANDSALIRPYAEAEKQEIFANWRKMMARAMPSIQDGGTAKDKLCGDALRLVLTAFRDDKDAATLTQQDYLIFLSASRAYAALTLEPASKIYNAYRPACLEACPEQANPAPLPAIDRLESLLNEMWGEVAAHAPVPYVLSDSTQAQALAASRFAPLTQEPPAHARMCCHILPALAVAVAGTDPSPIATLLVLGAVVAVAWIAYLIGSSKGYTQALYDAPLRKLSPTSFAHLAAELREMEDVLSVLDADDKESRPFLTYTITVLRLRLHKLRDFIDEEGGPPRARSVEGTAIVNRAKNLNAEAHLCPGSL